MTAPQRQRFHQAATRCPARGSIAIEKIMDKFYCPIATSSLAESLPIGRNDAARLRGSRARGRHDTLEIETLHARGPCTRDRNADDEQQQGRVQGTHLPRQEQPNILHDEIPLADNSLTRPRTVTSSEHSLRRQQRTGRRVIQTARQNPGTTIYSIVNGVEMLTIVVTIAYRGIGDRHVILHLCAEQCVLVSILEFTTLVFSCLFVQRRLLYPYVFCVRVYDDRFDST